MTTCIFIFIAIFCQTTAEVFLLSVDKEWQNEIVEQYQEKEKVENKKEKNELNPTTLEFVGNMLIDDVVGADYSSSSTKAWATVTVFSGGSWWYCRYQTNKK